MDTDAKQIQGAYDEIMENLCFLRVRDPDYRLKILQTLAIAEEAYTETLENPLPELAEARGLKLVEPS